MRVRRHLTPFPWSWEASSGDPAPIRSLQLVRIDDGPEEGMTAFIAHIPSLAHDPVALVAAREKWVELVIQLMRALGVRQEEVLGGISGLVIARTMDEIGDIR